MIKKILVAYDGSRPAMKAFEFAADVARRYQGELFVLTVAQLPAFADDVEVQANIEYSSECHQMFLDGLRFRVAALGIAAHLNLVVGNLARAILECLWFIRGGGVRRKCGAAGLPMTPGKREALSGAPPERASGGISEGQGASC